MQKIKNILVAVDISKNSQALFERALFFAKKFSAKLFVLHVIPELPYERATHNDEIVKLMNQWEEEANQVLEKNIRETIHDQVEVETEVKVGAPLRTILQSIEKSKADMLILGHEGKKGISGFLLGKTSESVVRKSWIPVWVERSAPMSQKEHAHEILLPVDFTPANKEVIQATIDWAKQLNWKLHFMHVLHAPYLPSYSLINVHLFQESLSQLGKEEFNDFIKSLDLAGLNYETHFCEGDPVSEIMRLVQERKIPLAALSARGQTDLSPRLLGSVALDLLRHLPCSILVLRPKSIDLSWLKEALKE